MDCFRTIADRRIREAIDRGALDDLPGKGKPLQLEDLFGVPDDLRMGYKILKNARVLPEELETRKELATLQGLIDACEDSAHAERLRGEQTWKRIRYRMLMERRRVRPGTSAYRRRVLQKLGS